MAKLPSADDIKGAPHIATGGAAATYTIAKSDSSASPGGSALVKLGEAMGQKADKVAAILEHENERTDTLRAEESFNQLRETQLDLTLGKENGITSLRGGDAANRPVLEEWTSKFNDRANQLAESLGNDRQREKFQHRTAIARAQFQGNILEHVAKEQDAYAKSVFHNGLDTETRNIGATPADESAANLSFTRGAALAGQEAKRLGMDAEGVALAKSKATDALWVARLEAWRLKDPAGALRAFQDNQDKLGPHVRVQVAEGLYRDAAPVLAASLNETGGPPVTATALARPPAQTPGSEIEYQQRLAADEERSRAAGGALKIPRGVRNNNPGNLIAGPTKWGGEIEGADPRYASFASAEAGIRALGKNLMAYGAKGVDTVEGIIGRWAPATENPTEDYVATVAKEMGVNPREPLNLRDRKTLMALANSIIKFENGGQHYSDEQVGAGIDAAISGKAMPYEAKRTPGFSAASPSNMTANDALSIVTGDPVIDRLPPDQKIAVFQLARTQANQGTAQAREALKQRYTDTVAAYERGQDAPNPPSPTELIGAYGQFDGERLSAEMSVARQFGQDVTSVQNLPATQQAALLAARAPRPGEGFAEASRRHDQLARAIDQVAKERTSDPAVAVLRNAPQVQAAYRTFLDRMASGEDAAGAAQAYASATLAEQQRLEISSPQILSKEMVGSVAKRFAEPPKDGEGVASVMRGMVDQWGRYWPQVGAELKKAIPPEAVVIGLGIKPEAEALLSEAVKLKPEALKQGLQETDIRDVRERIRKEFEPLQRTLAWQGGGIETYDNFADAAEKLSIALMQKGVKPKDAVAKSFESMAGFKYDFEDSWRVPKTAIGGATTLSALRAGAVASQYDVGSDKPILGERVALLVPQAPGAVRPADAEQQWRETIKANGFWVTSPGDGGLSLYVKSGLSAQPVLDAEGRPVRRTWAELSSVGNSVRAATMADVAKRRP